MKMLTDDTGMGKGLGQGQMGSVGISRFQETSLVE